jgi:tRNA dimethylallyltransferase
MKNPIIVIAGATASGKTALAVELAKKFNGEIINADSRTVYRGLNVATSKPTMEEMKGVPHHLFDIVNPDEPFTLADYKRLAETAIKEVQEKGKIPFLVGGTGLYIDAVIYNFNMTEAEPNAELRKELEAKTEAKLFAEIQKLDPETAEIIDSHNKRRLIRALEVILTTERSFAESKQKIKLPTNVLYLAIDVPREELYEKIEKRIENWENLGLVEETKRLKQKYSLDLPSMSSIGYQEISDALDGKIYMQAAIDVMKKRTRNYAKRQLTWFRKNRDIVWIKTPKEAEEKISNFINS